MDIHSHILPGIDDGSKDWEETIEMLKKAYSEDIHIIIATPHYGRYNPSFNIHQARSLVAEVNRRMEYLPFKINIFLGNELYYVPDIVRDVIDGKAATMAGSSYVLVEFAESVHYNTVLAAVQEFTRAGYRPIIAHVERYRNLRDKNLDMIRELRQLGAYFQVNVSNFTHRERTGLFNKENRSTFVQSLLKADLIDFIASDAHNASSRLPVMKSAVNIIRNTISEEQYNRIFYYNMLAIAKNEYIGR